MAHKTLIDGTAYSVTGGRDLIGGTGYAKKLGRTLINGTGYDVPFSKGTQIGDLAVGSTVKTAVNGTAKEFIVVHQGLPSSLYDGSCNGTWLLMKDIYESREWNSSDKNEYKGSTIHTYLNGTFLNLFDADIKAQIKTVKIPYVNGTVYSGSNGLSAQMFLLSGCEVGLGGTRYMPGDGEKLDYFESGTGTSANNKRIAYLNGKATNWWLRSPYTYIDPTVWCVRSGGDCDDYSCTNTYGVRPAFILPQTALVAEDGTIL